MATNFPGFSRTGEEEGARAVKSESASELLYKMCKKIAQLTKVIYVLNTRNDDLEMQCKSAADVTEEKIASATEELRRTVSHLKAELEKKIDLNERVKGLEETLKQRDQELRKLLDEIATVRKRQEERERELSCAYRMELGEAAEAQQHAEIRLAQVLAAQESRRFSMNRQKTTEYQVSFSQKENSAECDAKYEKRRSLEESEVEEEMERKKKEQEVAAAEEDGKKRGGGREQEVAEFRRLVGQLQKDLKEKTERWEAVAKEERSKLEAQLERAKAAKEDAEKLLAQQLQAESRNLVSQEARYQEKLSELSGQLAVRECEANRLRLEIEELRRELVAKTSGMDRLQAELAASNKEGEYVKQTLRRMEEDVTGFRHKNTELADELQKKNDEIEALREEKREMERKNVNEEEESVRISMEKIKELERRAKELEERTAELVNERDQLSNEKRQLEAEREEEMKIVQEALDEAIEEKASIQARFERDFETLRTVNTDREQQLLDDFEWKLREVQATCKRKLEERDRVNEEKVKTISEEAETQLAIAKQELATLKTHEAELAQLRGLTHEQQRSLRMGIRQIESLQVSEKILQEEASKLRELLEQEKTLHSKIQNLHDKKLGDLEKSWKNRLEALRNELNFSWEERLKRDINRLKIELEALHLDEKKKLELEASIKAKAERREMEKKLKEASEVIIQLKTTLEGKEANWRRDLEKTQANSDRDILDLRRKLDKLDMSYQDQIENMAAKHQRELEQLNEEAELRMTAAEQNWQMQLGSTRATLELVKEQMERDAQKREEALQDEYQAKLECQWKRLNEEKKIALLSAEKKFIQQLEILKEEMGKSSKNSTVQESEHLHKIIDTQTEERNCQTKIISDLQGNVDALQGGMQVLNEELTGQIREKEKLQNEAGAIQRKREAQHLRELEAIRNAHSQDALKWQMEKQAMRGAIQWKTASPSTISEEWQLKCPQTEDIQPITNLPQTVNDKEWNVVTLNEEKCQVTECTTEDASTEPPVRPRRKGENVTSPTSGEETWVEADRKESANIGNWQPSRRCSWVPAGESGVLECSQKMLNVQGLPPSEELQCTVTSPEAAAAPATRLPNRTRSRSVDLATVLTVPPQTSLRSCYPTPKLCIMADLPHSSELHLPSISSSLPPLHAIPFSPIDPTEEVFDLWLKNVALNFDCHVPPHPEPPDTTPP